MLKQPSNTSSRQSSLDFLKLFLVFLVVAGHIIERYSLGQGQVIYRWIYLFHMPAFIFLSGMLSSSTIDAKGGRRLLTVIILPLLAHQIALKGFESTLFHRDFNLGISVPYWALWYLMSLLLWRLLLPILMGSGQPLFLSIALSLAVGYFKDFGYAWSLSRTFVFLPFFVAGHLYAATHGRELPAFKTKRMIQACILLFSLLAVAWLTRSQPVKWLYSSFSYAEYASTHWQGLSLRALQLVAGAAGILAVMRLAITIPGVSNIGKYSMAIFISHIYVLKLAESQHWFSLLPQHGFPTRIATVILCSLLCTGIGIATGRWLPQLFDFEWIFNFQRRKITTGDKTVTH